MIHTLALHASSSMNTAMSPRLQRAVRLLQMSSQDFSQVLRDALDNNPFLEVDEETSPAAAADDDGQFDLPSDGGAWGADAPRGRGGADTVDGEALAMLVAPTTLAEHLEGQLNVMPLSLRDRALALAIAGSLDDDGYLRTPLDEIAAAAPLLPAADAQELVIALRRIQALDPAGVGARSVAECLALQLRQLPPCAQTALAEEIALRHLQALVHRDIGALSRRLGASPAAVESAIAAIRRLDPRPGWRVGAQTVQYLTPDVIVRQQRGQWVATLNPAVVPRLRLNRSYADLFCRLRDARHAELGAHLQEAKWTLRNVDQRFATILGVSRAILKRQERFLVYGAMAMKPLALREIAQEVGVHESTVSRVTNNKYMATPFGTYELKYFFSRGLDTANGGECSPTAIRGLIQEMITAETPERPLSDVELARQLAQQGLCVARRTVTKYRQLLRIAPADRRRPLVSA
ncbi:MAG TPA: RNA polymerase factor sigma-54 [Ramlibacter sp.]|nr:RNA polymerase factor sigma-54 [Ramlibacter sp.]